MADVQIIGFGWKKRLDGGPIWGDLAPARSVRLEPLLFYRKFADLYSHSIAEITDELVHQTLHIHQKPALIPICDPEHFGKNKFPIDYPCSLPCFMAGMIIFLAVIVGCFFSAENQIHHASCRATDCFIDRYLFKEQNSEFTAELQLTRLSTPTVISVLLGCLLVFFQISSLTTLIRLFAYTRFEGGGLGSIYNKWVSAQWQYENRQIKVEMAESS
ncbi:hypothetical protein PSTG_11120 [Puccinia striiformis f. sp. tritici PST-78]|uniref:Uncharacterized protein n=1 Tax=Puccinia striiformis f. sp. tritici PST-78 TaxID=1165861 RepID=A0A0L0V965_9BASI|nr:hypothetical protein PSTG_11120 [Puccinia striiformis f. sp. tritici PST-78]